MADLIGASLGRFNAIHVRRDDFVRLGFTPRCRAMASGEEIVATLASQMDRDDLLVICTDSPSEEGLFAPIRRHFRQTVFLDHYLLRDRAFREALLDLPYHDSTVLALLTQLVASKAQVFAGTLFSTFTALIHRLRGFAGRNEPFLYCYNEFDSPLVRFERGEFLPVDDGPYSWNRTPLPTDSSSYSWMREWPEAFARGPMT